MQTPQKEPKIVKKKTRTKSRTKSANSKKSQKSKLKSKTLELKNKKKDIQMNEPIYFDNSAEFELQQQSSRYLFSDLVSADNPVDFIYDAQRKKSYIPVLNSDRVNTIF